MKMFYIIVLLFCLFMHTGTVQAQTIPATELSGFAWSSNIGWISLNCKNDSNCATSDYRVTINADRTITGWGWSSNLGWIKFGGLSGFPTGGGTTAENANLTGTYPNLTWNGWARACAGDGLDVNCQPTATSTTGSSTINWSYHGTTAQVFKQFNFGASYGETVAYGGGRFVALANNASTNSILTTLDGASWTSATIPTGDWLAVTYGNGRFVAVTYQGTNRIMYSADGLSWTAVAAPAGGANAWRSVTYGNGLFVAVACGLGTTCGAGTGNFVMTSPDGVTWTARSAPGKIWNSVTYGNGLFVAVSESTGSGNIMTSPDGITWTSRTSALTGFYKVVYGNGRFVATSWLSPSAVATSPDGITWSSQTLTGVSSLSNIMYANNLFYGVSSGLFSSSDGASWSAVPLPGPAIDGAVFGYGNNRFVLAETGFAATKDIYSATLTITSMPVGTVNGWDGWIALRGTNFAVSANMTTGMNTNSYAWGGDVVGWVDMFSNISFTTVDSSLSGTGCTIPLGSGTCGTTLTWDVDSSLSSPNLYRATTPTGQLSTSRYDTNFPVTLSHGYTTFHLRSGTTILTPLTVQARCAAGLTYNGSTCIVGTGTTSPSITLKAVPPIVRTGGRTSVEWTLSTLSGSTCVLNGPGLSNVTISTLVGSTTTGVITSTATVRLTCTGAYGSVDERATVEVIPVAEEV